MLPEIGLLEFVVLAIVALVVVGPRDLPKLMRMAGGAVAKVRGLAQDFRSSFDEMGREMELEELRREIDSLKRGNPIAEVRRELADVEREARGAVTAPPPPVPPPTAPPPTAATPATLTPDPGPRTTSTEPLDRDARPEPAVPPPPADEAPVGQARVSNQA